MRRSVDFASVLTKNRGYIGPMHAFTRSLLAASPPFSWLSLRVPRWPSRRRRSRSRGSSQCGDPLRLDHGRGRQAAPLRDQRHSAAVQPGLLRLAHVSRRPQPGRVAEGGAHDLAAGRAGDRRPRDRGQRRQDQGHDAHARDRDRRRPAALLVHHPRRSAGHLHLRHQHRRRAARRVRVLRHRGAGPESQHRSARAQLPQQVQRRRARPAAIRKAS